MDSTMIASIMMVFCVMLNSYSIYGYPLDNQEELPLHEGRVEVPQTGYVQNSYLDTHPHPLNIDGKQPIPPSYYQFEDGIQKYRSVRSLQPGAPNFPIPGQNNNDGWRVQPSLSKGQDGNTRGSVNVQHSGPNHEVNAQVDKVIRGPGKSKPTYSIHGSWNF
ncbi:hypothetical protein HHI36_020529 [Cryptolaemus montrouzieri]|uniref:Uncharacterized protein n=1 Tax=Cryptolaemus montrouzieri TaxID=559131 RepID=A0ABD2NB02_9CUCU